MVVKLSNHGWFARAHSRPVIIDSDADNEIDDHFAVAWALAGLDVAALYAAPFHNERSTDAAAGMTQSAVQLRRVRRAMGREDIPVRKGTAGYLTDGPSPHSEAVDDLIERTVGAGMDLTLVCIGAVTNLACALSLEPRVAEHLSVVCLGGQPPWSWDDGEFNFSSDPDATSAVLAAALDLMIVPCRGVAELLHTTLPELRFGLRESRIRRHLLRLYREQVAPTPGIGRPIWDMAAVACLLTPDAVVASNEDERAMVQWVNRSAIFTDFFARLKPTVETARPGTPFPR